VGERAQLPVKELAGSTDPGVTHECTGEDGRFGDKEIIGGHSMADRSVVTGTV
jgi:hypothetical protein